MNLIREIKQYQAPDGTCFNTKEKQKKKKKKSEEFKALELLVKNVF